MQYNVICSNTNSWHITGFWQVTAPCSDSGCARVVGLDAAQGDHCVGAILQRLGHQKLELPYLHAKADLHPINF